MQALCESAIMSRVKKLIHMGYTSRNRVALIRGGRPYFKLLHELIDKATQSIHLQFYIFLDDDTGNAVIRSLVGSEMCIRDRNSCT